MLNKFQKYLEAGVREYWIVDPDKKTIHACVLQDRRYIVSVYRGSDAAPVTVLPGCEINLKEVFAG
ncbi:hypothetical protein FACS1894109_21270 [Spirochaetia bacterium]|nr:hypothetical protein FACS1894109_21270 [Spirochaetia bacterium]